MATKNIAILIDDAYGYAGTENVANYMTECLGDDYSITLFSLNGNGKTFYPFSKVKNIITFAGKRFKLVTTINVLKKNDYDVVFVISMGKLSIAFTFFCIILGYNKVIVACEHIALDSFPKKITYLKYFFLKKISSVVVLTKRDMNKYISKGINAVHIPNPVQYKGYIRNQRSHNIIAVGRLEHQKGFERLLKIWSIFKQNDNKHKLIIAGDGALKDYLISLACQLDVIDSVDFLGKVKDIDKLYQNSDLLLMTSYYEGMPLALLEAKSWSLPVVSYDCPTGPKEIIEDGIDGFLIKEDDYEAFVNKLTTLCNNDTLYFQMSSNTAITSNKFSSKMISDSWKSLVN